MWHSGQFQVCEHLLRETLLQAPGDPAGTEGDEDADDCSHRADILTGGTQEVENIKAKSTAG